MSEPTIIEKIVAHRNHKKPTLRVPLFIELYLGTHYIGAVCFSLTQQRWAATWNAHFPDDDPNYRFVAKADAIQEVYRRQEESNGPT